MSKTSVLEWFDSNSVLLTGEKIIFYLVIALVIALGIYLTYRATYTGVSYNERFAITNVVILLIAAVLMMMISSNIAISLGMVGALSIVRYRTAIKDPNDTLFIFWSIIEGLCVGAQMIRLAVISTLFIAIVIISISYFGIRKQKYLLVIRGSAGLSADNVIDRIGSLYAKKRIRTVNVSDTGVEMIVEVTGKHPVTEEHIAALKEVSGVKSVNWLLQTGENIG